MTSLAKAWEAVAAAAARLKGTTLAALFADDPGRFGRFSARAGELLLDFSKEKLDADALEALLALARAAGVEAQRDAMAAGAPVNNTESRAALHMALRGGADAKGAEAKAGRDRFLAYAEKVRASETAHVIALGIGGSSLGPELVTKALAPWHSGPVVHYVSNVDGTHLADALKCCDPARTLVIAASKTFTTEETLTNARSARAWLEAAIGDQAGARMAAVTANRAAAAEFGIAEQSTFAMWDWVGGRYSVWSAVGLPTAIAIGAEAFRAFLDGAGEMDRHFRTAPLAENLPVLLGLIGIWRRNAMDWPSYALIPYDARLGRLSAWLQQLEMESNGKRVDRDGKPLTRATAPVVWGEPGSDAQHSFFQLLHQGTDVVPVDFLIGSQAVDGLPGHHDRLVANALAQSAALAFGTPEGTEPHRICPGDRPSTTLAYRRLDPATLGALLALYEHKVFVQAAIWGINAFDQFGVELGKSLARNVLGRMSDGGSKGLDSSSAGLFAFLQGGQA